MTTYTREFYNLPGSISTSRGRTPCCLYAGPKFSCDVLCSIYEPTFAFIVSDVFDGFVFVVIGGRVGWLHCTQVRPLKECK